MSKRKPGLVTVSLSNGLPYLRFRNEKTDKAYIDMLRWDGFTVKIEYDDGKTITLKRIF